MTYSSDKSNDRRDVLKIGVSSCLMGARVRYDGKHKKNANVINELGKYLRLVPVCPEVEAGFGIPREKVRLEGTNINYQLIGQETGDDKTELIVNYARTRVREKDISGLSGFAAKRNSPSCGGENLKVYRGNSIVSREGSGFFVSELISLYPTLPIVDENNLKTEIQCEHFIRRVVGYYCLGKFFNRQFEEKKFKLFHEAAKRLMLSPGTKPYRQLNQIVLKIDSSSYDDIIMNYRGIFMQALKMDHINNINMANAWQFMERVNNITD